MGGYADAEAAARRAISKGGMKDPAEGTLILGMAWRRRENMTQPSRRFGEVDGNDAARKTAHLWTSLCADEKGTGGTRCRTGARALTRMRWDRHFADPPPQRGHDRRRETDGRHGAVHEISAGGADGDPARLRAVHRIRAVVQLRSVDLALWVAFASAFVIAIRDFAHSRLLRMLDVGSVALFGLLSLYVGFIQPGIPIQMARLVVDGGLFAMAVLSILLRHPLTLQYAREQVPQEFWPTARFVFTNYLDDGRMGIGIRRHGACRRHCEQEQGSAGLARHCRQPARPRDRDPVHRALPPLFARPRGAERAEEVKFQLLPGSRAVRKG